jgi:hypothetical protein
MVKVGKHFDLDIGERHFSLTRKHQAIEAEAALDGIDIIRTNVPAEPMEAAECVRPFSCACSPTMSNGTCARRGGS